METALMSIITLNVGQDSIAYINKLRDQIVYDFEDNFNTSLNAASLHIIFYTQKCVKYHSCDNCFCKENQPYIEFFYLNYASFP